MPESDGFHKPGGKKVNGLKTRNKQGFLKKGYQVHKRFIPPIRPEESIKFPAIPCHPSGDPPRLP
jgi:hypothetical protein